MSPRLRSNYEPGSMRDANRRAQWKAMGLTDEDLEKPKIAVVNSSSELAMRFRHLDGIAAIVKEAIWSAGGLPFEIRTTAPSDFIVSAGGRGGYILYARGLLPDDQESDVVRVRHAGASYLAALVQIPPAH